MRQFTAFFGLILSVCLWAEIPAGYYTAAEGTATSELKTKLYSIISKNTIDVGYDGLYNIYKTSDITSTGKVWDMYSTCTWIPDNKKCGEYKVVCDCYNREHSIPQSWFSKKSPMVSDAFHIYPTDGKVNGQRSNYPFGESSFGVTLTNGKGKLGNCTFPGYSGLVFEPDNEYKGDFARTYFYFATRYENIMSSIGGESFNHTLYPSLSDWSIQLFLKWHRQDPVSEKEIIRNNAIEKHQKNRNPFIDYPLLAEYIWGTKVGELWGLASGLDNLTIDFNISPNPVQDILVIKTDEPIINVTIYNLNGQILIQDVLNNRTSISTSQLSNGMYLIQVNNGLRKSIRKFIVNK